jgi:hypothetical protein
VRISTQSCRLRRPLDPLLKVEWALCTGLAAANAHWALTRRSAWRTSRSLATQAVREWLGPNDTFATGGIDFTSVGPHGTPGLLSVTFDTTASKVTVTSPLDSHAKRRPSQHRDAAVSSSGRGSVCGWCCQDDSGCSLICDLIISLRISLRVVLSGRHQMQPDLQLDPSRRVGMPGGRLSRARDGQRPKRFRRNESVTSSTDERAIDGVCRGATRVAVSVRVMAPHSRWLDPEHLVSGS